MQCCWCWVDINYRCKISQGTTITKDFWQEEIIQISSEFVYSDHVALTLAPCALQCPASLRRTCEPFLWRRTRRWSHGQSLHGWHCTVCWKATGLCFGPSSLTEVGAVGARPNGRCRVIITYLILNLSNSQPTHPTTQPPTYLSVSVVGYKVLMCVCTFLIKHFLFLCFFNFFRGGLVIDI